MIVYYVVFDDRVLQAGYYQEYWFTERPLGMKNKKS